MEELKTTYGLIGNPLAHSLSPVMHNTAFRELGVDAVYKLFPLQEEELADFFQKLRAKDSPIFGLNVTVPYKEKVLPYLDSISPFADKAGAVNTIVISKERKFIGYNTDGPGFLTHLTECGFKPENKRIAVLGAGGASRAIISVLALITERPQSIRLFDIDRVKAQTLVRDLGTRFDVNCIEVVDSIDDLNIELSDLLINATPVGMKPEDPCLVSAELLHPHLFVYDVIYNPAETKLLKLARQKGAVGCNGLGMLFYQGILSFQHWAEIQLDPVIKEKIRQNLEEALRL